MRYAFLGWVLGALLLAPTAGAANPRPAEAESHRVLVKRGHTESARRGTIETEVAKTRRGTASSARRWTDARPDRMGRRDLDPRDFFVRLVPPQLPSLVLEISGFESFVDELDLVWNQVWTALFFFLLLLGWRRLFDGDRAMQVRAHGPYNTFVFYFVVVVFVVLSGVYTPSINRTLHLLSLFVLVLAIIQSLTVFVVDGFMLRGRGVAVPVIVRDVSALVLYIVAAIIVLSHFGVDLTSILTGSVVVTAVVGLAFQDTLGSIAGGLALQVEQPFQEGDWLEMDGLVGRVLEINWRSTKLWTPRNETVHIPNKEITSARVTNWSRPDRFHRREIDVGLPYAVPPNQCKDVLEAAARTEGVLTDPPPFATLKDYGDSSIVYTLYFFIENIAQQVLIDDRVRTNVWYRLQRDGISIPFPIRDITIHKAAPEMDKQRRADEKQARMDALSQIPILTVLKAPEMLELAERVKVQTFGAGEYIFHQGERGDSLFIVDEGEVEVLAHAAGSDRQRRVAMIHAGDFFGEMSLMTGERRSATIRALTDARFFVIDRAAFGEILSDHVEVTTAIAKLLEDRDRNMAQKTREPTRTENTTLPPQVDDGLLERIRSFFGL